MNYSNCGFFKVSHSSLDTRGSLRPTLFTSLHCILRNFFSDNKLIHSWNHSVYSPKGHWKFFISGRCCFISWVWFYVVKCQEIESVPLLSYQQNFPFMRFSLYMAPAAIDNFQNLTSCCFLKISRSNTGITITL